MKTLPLLALAFLLVVPEVASAQLYSRYSAPRPNPCGGNRVIGVFEFERCPSAYAPGYGPPTYPPGGVSPGSPVMCGFYPCANQPPAYFADRPPSYGRGSTPYD